MLLKTLHKVIISKNNAIKFLEIILFFNFLTTFLEFKLFLNIQIHFYYLFICF
jgi:hypothetical protein